MNILQKKIEDSQEKTVNLQSLNEAKKTQVNVNLETVVLKTKSKQFVFECGCVMARMSVQLDTRFGLYWHAKQTDSFDGFVASIEKFLQAAGFAITDIDKKLLQKQYSKK